MSQRVALGVGGGELAAGVAGAGDEAGADAASRDQCRPSASIAALHVVDIFARRCRR